MNENKEIHFAFVATDQKNDLTAHLIRQDHHPTMSPALSFNVFFFLPVDLHKISNVVGMFLCVSCF